MPPPSWPSTPASGSTCREGHDSPYMLLTAPVAERAAHVAIEQPICKSCNRIPIFAAALAIVRSTIPAVTHVDLSARVQTVDADRNPAFHALLTEFHKLTGCPVLANTSFNVRGEPIVCTPERSL